MSLISLHVWVETFLDISIVLAGTRVVDVYNVFSKICVRISLLALGLGLTLFGVRTLLLRKVDVDIGDCL